MKKILKIISFIFLCNINSPVFAQRMHTSLDKDWKFHFGDAADPVKDFNYGITAIYSKAGKTDNTSLALDFNDSTWRSLNLPHDWASELAFTPSANFDVQSHGYRPVGSYYPETSIGWYRKHLRFSSSDSGQRFQLQFDGIFRDATAWINGHYLANNKSGYVGFTCDITDFINFDKDNIISIRVDATQYEGWFYEGAGIYRHVWLNQYDNLHLVPDGIFVHSIIKNNRAVVYIETELENNSLQQSPASLFTYITDRNGKKLTQSKEIKFGLPVNGKLTLIDSLAIAMPHIWTLEDPYLYRVVSVIKQNGNIIDSVKNRFGIRTMEIKPNGFFLNGIHIKIKGTNNHQDHAGVGTAMPDFLQYYRINLLKDLGCNAYRTSHHAPTPELLDACDSLGMLVMDEQRLLNSSPEYVGQFERLIKRDRNHPSIFLWSIGNEEGWVQTTSTGKRIAQTLLAKQQELDPYRSSTYAADVPNIFTGVNEVIPVRGFNYRQFAVADYHKDHPLQPLIGTEMGSTVTTRGIYIKDSIRAYVPDQDIVAPWWASTAETWWQLAANNDYWLGGFIWTGFDYHGEPTPYQWPNISSHFGVMDLCGFPKNIYYYYQSWWTEKDVMHISPHWNWKGMEGKPIEVWVNSNAEQVELFLNGKSLGKKIMPRNGHLNWLVNYTAGKLEAIGYKNNRQIKSFVETTGEPYAIILIPYKKTFDADGVDGTVINVHVVDTQNRELPDASNKIQLMITGDAHFIGIGNGDPSSHEPGKYFDKSQWQRHFFNGKAQVLLQSGNTEGKIKVEASSVGLLVGKTELLSVTPIKLK